MMHERLHRLSVLVCRGRFLAPSINACNCQEDGTAAAPRGGRARPTKLEYGGARVRLRLGTVGSTTAGRKREFAKGRPAKVNFREYGGWIARQARAHGKFGCARLPRARPDANYGESSRFRLDFSGDQRRLTAWSLMKGDSDVSRAVWSEVLIPRARSTRRAPFDRIIFHAAKPVGSAWISLDKSPSPRRRRGPPPSPMLPTTTSSLSVDCRGTPAPISQEMYGTAYGAVKTTYQFDIGRDRFRRWGGNRASRYNWEIGNVSNAGRDWFWRMARTRATSPDTPIDSSSRRTGAPHGVGAHRPHDGWVAKDSNSFSFPVPNVGLKKETDPWRPEAGNGITRAGRRSPRPPTLTSVPVTRSSSAVGVTAIREADAKSGSGACTSTSRPTSLRSGARRTATSTPPRRTTSCCRDDHLRLDHPRARPGRGDRGPAEWGWTGLLLLRQSSATGVSPNRIGSPRRHAAHRLVP